MTPAAARRPRNAVATTMVHLGVANDIRQTLEAAGIRCALLKGTAFVDTLYDDPVERPMGDIDILVSPRHKPVIEAVVAHAGLALCPPHPSHPASWRNRYNWKFRAERGPLVELHFALSPLGLYTIDIDAALDRVVVRRKNGRTIPTLDPVDALIGMAVHAANHGYGIPEHNREDVVRLIHRWRPDWDAVAERSRVAGAQTAVYAALVGASARGADVPADALHAVTPRHIHRAVLHRILDLPSGTPHLPVEQHVWAQAATLATLTDHWRQWARFGRIYAKRRTRDVRAWAKRRHI